MVYVVNSISEWCDVLMTDTSLFSTEEEARKHYNADTLFNREKRLLSFENDKYITLEEQHR